MVFHPFNFSKPREDSWHLIRNLEFFADPPAGRIIMIRILPLVPMVPDEKWVPCPALIVP